MEDQLVEQPYQPIASEPPEVEEPILEPEEDPNLLPSKLVVVFAETYTLLLKTQSAHWNGVGPQAFYLHLLHERVYSELYAGLDALAEVIRGMDVIVPASFPQIIQYSKIQSIEGSTSMPNGFEMVSILLDDHKILLQSLANAAECAEECQGSLNLIGDLSQQCMSHIYLLGSLLK